MRLSPAIVIGAFALAACGERDAAPTSAEKVSAEVKTSDAVRAVPKVLTAGELRRVCRQGLAHIYGQTPSTIKIEGGQSGVAHASWRAPVNGGRTRVDCRVENDLVVWKPLDLPDATLVRWMNRPGDPVIRYKFEANTVTITQTLPNGTPEQANLAVPAEEEAR